MNKQVLITGANGQLGQSLKQLASYYPQFICEFIGRNELDLSKPELIDSFFDKHSYDIIINCAAYTAVDKAEDDEELADAINHKAVQSLAQIAKRQNATLIQVSTDYVFNGESFKPYQENAPTDPQGVYGLTKLKGEQAFLEVSPSGCIIRTSWVYSEYGNNFVKTMLRLGKERDDLGVIFDQIGTPTYAGDLANTILQLLTNHASPLAQKSEIFHFSNEGVCSWYDFAKSIFEFSDIECKVNPIETKDYPTPAKRPNYSVLNKHKIKQTFGLEIPYWKDSLKVCLNNLQEQN